MRNCRVVQVLMVAYLASFVGNPTRKRSETATAHTGGRYVSLKKTINNKH
jgi:hypothetical protein